MTAAAGEITVCSEEWAELGEGVRWDPAAQELIWVDILAGIVRRASVGNDMLHTTATWTVPRPVGAVTPAAGGGLVLATGTGFSALDARGRETWLATAEPGAEAQLRMNDGACDPAGRFLAGTMAYDTQEGAGTLWCLDVDGSVRPLLTGLTISNGLGWSPDGRTFYLADSGPATVEAFAYDVTSGTLTERRQFFALPGDEGAPDGLCVDVEGCLWVAVWGGAELRRYSPDGDLLDRIEAPVSQPTSVCLGSPTMDQLFVATATHRLSEDALLRQPLAGRMLRTPVKVAGMPITPYAGPIPALDPPADWPGPFIARSTRRRG